MTYGNSSLRKYFDSPQTAFYKGGALRDVIVLPLSHAYLKYITAAVEL